MKIAARLVGFALTLFASYGSIEAQTCRLSTVTGGSSTVTNVSGYPVTGTALSNSDTVDFNYYQVTNALGLGPTAVVRSMYSDWVQTNANAQNNDPSAPHAAYYGASFLNTTNQSITVTEVDFTTDVDNFTPTTVTGVVPASGWTLVSRRLAKWTGSVTVASRDAQDFIFGDSPQNNAASNTTRTVNLNVSVITGSGAFTATPFTMTALTSNNSNASNAVVSIDLTGAALPPPQIFIRARTSTAPVNLSIRVAETGDNGTSSDIASPLQLTVTIPARWSSVSVPTIAAPWSSATLSITQPTATTNGQITISTNAVITHNSVTTANSLVIRATAPSSSVTNLFPFRLALSGQSAGGRTIDSFNDSVVQVLGNGTEAVNSQFLSSTIGPGPVRQLDFSTAFNVSDGVGGESVAVNVWNNTTSAWDLIQTITPGSTNATVTRTFTTDFLPYVDGSNRMKIQFLSNGTTVRTLRLDQIKWTMTLGYTVNNATGSDTNAGNIAQPFRTVGKAASVLGASGAIYVEVGNSQSGTPYDHDASITAAGTSGCPTLVQGVASGGVLPLIHGVNPAADSGISAGANWVQVDSLQVDNSLVGLYSDVGFSNVRFSNSYVKVPDGAYGILLQTNTSSTAIGNRVEATGSNGTAIIGVWDFAGTSNTLDGNKVSGFVNLARNGGGEAISTTNAASPTIQRNIVRGNYAGIHFAGSTGTVNLFNNTSDSNVYLGVYSERSSTVTSRNNIISNNGVGWGWDGIGTVSSNYDDVFNNANDYNFHALVVAGANSISANPNFIQTSNPALTGYYKLNSGSPCINAGTNVGLPFLGAAPDIGAVESQ